MKGIRYYAKIGTGWIAALTVTLMLGVGLLCVDIIGMNKTNTTATEAIEKYAVLIDPGHGGIDAGATGNGVVEKEINLEIAKFLKCYIETNGGTAYMTRTEDTNTADPNREKGVTQKSSDLKNRKQSIENLKADIFVSIHINKFREPKYYGAQVFYDGGAEENRLLAEEIQQSLKETLNDGNTRTAKATGDSIYVLKGNTVPSVLVECGFLSNPKEAALLKKAEYQQQVAWGIYVGIMRFVSR